jgi:hypothetical protein
MAGLAAWVGPVENDPLQTCPPQSLCSAHCRTVPISLNALSCFDALSRMPNMAWPRASGGQ